MSVDPRSVFAALNPLCPFPVIEVRDSGFSALLDKAPSIANRLDSVLANVNEILGEDNRQFVTRMLDDLASVSEKLAAEKDFPFAAVHETFRPVDAAIDVPADGACNVGDVVFASVSRGGRRTGPFGAENVGDLRRIGGRAHPF